MKVIEKYGMLIVGILLILNLFIGCGMNSRLSKLSKSLEETKTQIVTEKRIIEIMDEKMWESLRIEEMSDKDHIPINQLKIQRQGGEK